jgi:hypothetical protein
MRSLEQAWPAINLPRDGPPVSPELQPLLREIYQALCSEPRDIPTIKRALRNLLQYLATDGPTNPNCWATDLFFTSSTDWEFDWAEPEPPEDLHNIFAKMGEALHDTVSTPEIARNFGCPPAQLLADLEKS